MATQPGGDHTAHKPVSTFVLIVGSIGVVYGDIGTSPLCALREGLAAATKGAPAGAGDVTGIVSLLLWLLIFIVTIKYVALILRADNRGEGGTLSLLALCQRAFGGRTRLTLTLGIIGTALFFGDAMITPAISVLSAVEGLSLIAPGFAPYVISVTIGIIVGLFLVQRKGTGGISRFFGPIMLVWFLMMAAMGIRHIMDGPAILAAFNPWHGISFLLQHGSAALPVLGSVFWRSQGQRRFMRIWGISGVGQFGLPRSHWYFHRLHLAIWAKGAMVLADPSKATNPFFLMAPEWALPGLVAFATVATIIASQAVLTGAFSVAHQAVQLGLLPRLQVRHTSATQQGQIYLPQLNTILMICVILLVLSFGSSARLATAYGIAVTGEMIMTTLLALIVYHYLWKWSRKVAVGVFVPLLVIELFLLAANLT